VRISSRKTELWVAKDAVLGESSATRKLARNGLRGNWPDWYREVGIAEVICKDSPTRSGLISNPEAPTMTFLVVCYAETYAGRGDPALRLRT
jgi:hypothetical protein